MSHQKIPDGHYWGKLSKQDQTKIKKYIDKQIKFLGKMEIISASPTRSGYQVQVRIRMDGKTGRYAEYSADIRNAKSICNNEFIHSIFGVKSQSKKIVKSTRYLFRIEGGMEEYLNFRKLKENKFMKKLAEQALKAMKKIIEIGKLKNHRTNAEKQKAIYHLRDAYDWALSHGVSDEKAKELLKEALVRHTMRE